MNFWWRPNYINSALHKIFINENFMELRRIELLTPCLARKNFVFLKNKLYITRNFAFGGGDQS